MAGAEALFALSKDQRRDYMLSLQLKTTTAQEICDGVVAMGETLLSCYLYGEIIARRHRPAFFVTSNTRCTQGYYKFLKISTSHTEYI